MKQEFFIATKSKLSLLAFLVSSIFFIKSFDGDNPIDIQFAIPEELSGDAQPAEALKDAFVGLCMAGSVAKNNLVKPTQIQLVLDNMLPFNLDTKKEILRVGAVCIQLMQQEEFQHLRTGFENILSDRKIDIKNQDLFLKSSVQAIINQCGQLTERDAFIAARLVNFFAVSASSDV